MLVTANLKRQRTARGLEVTLHAGFELPFPVERRRVRNRTSARYEVVRLDRVNVRLPWPVTPLRSTVSFTRR